MAWWKQQLEREIADAAAAAVSKERSKYRNDRPSRRYRRSGYGSSSGDEYDGAASSAAERDRVDELRDALRASRRQLEAGARRERALRRALHDEEELLELEEALTSSDRPRRRGPRRLDEERGDRLRKPHPPRDFLAGSHHSPRAFPRQYRDEATTDGVEVDGWEGVDRPRPRSVVDRLAEQLALASGCGAPGASCAATSAAPTRSTAPLPPPPARSGAGEPFVRPFAAEVEAAASALLEAVLAAETTGVVRGAIRDVVSARVPLRAQRRGERYEWVWSSLLTDLVADEAPAVVGEALRALASEHVARRGAERTCERLVAELVEEEALAVAAEARAAVAVASVVDDAIEPMLREVAVWAMHEARGAAAKGREREEREAVGACAAECVVEHLLLERLLQHVQTNGEALLMQREAARLLDELLADGLARHALRLSQRRDEVMTSAVLRGVHSQLAYSAVADEMIAQLVRVCASGYDAPKRAAFELPSESEESGDENDEAEREAPEGG